MGALLFLAGAALAQVPPSLPADGFVFTREHFAAAYPSADVISFSSPLERWDLVSDDRLGRTIYTSKAPWNPEKLRTNLLAPGFSAYFPQGIRFRITSTASPFLSWADGSVNSDIPTPASPWLALSFRDNQPPLVVGFLDQPASLQITGKPGDWTVESSADFRGWVRIALPRGDQPYATNSAASLGRLSNEIAPFGELWSGPEPAIVSHSVTADASGVTESTTYNRGSILIPTRLALAPIAGYQLAISTAHRRLPMVVGQTPVELSSDATLTVRYPIRQILEGRALTLGMLEANPIGTASPFDVAGVCELALENLIGQRDRLTDRAANETLEAFLEQTELHDVPGVSTKLPFRESGEGVDLVAAQAMLQRSIRLAEADGGQDNSLFDSISTRIDVRTGLPIAADPKVARRAAAIAAIAGALNPRPEVRLAAAQLQAAISGMDGLVVWRRRNQITVPDERLADPLLGVRQGIFKLTNRRERGADFVDALMSPLRVVGDVEAWIEPGWVLSWRSIENKPGLFELLSPDPVNLLPTENLEKLVVDERGRARVIYTPTVGGIVRANLIGSESRTVPASVPTPRYTE